MKNTTKDNIQELSKSLDKQHSKSKETFTRERIEGTPFEIIKNKGEKKYFAVLGSKRVTEIYDNEKKPTEEVKKINWNNIIIVMTELMKMESEITKLTKK